MVKSLLLSERAILLVVFCEGGFQVPWRLLPVQKGQRPLPMRIPFAGCIKKGIACCIGSGCHQVQCRR